MPSQEESKCTPATKTELNWIEDFRKICAKCPKNLWLFSASGTLTVMKIPENGNKMGSIDGSGVNRDNIITTIPGIKNDGGDW